MSDNISRQASIRWVKTECNPYGKPTLDYESGKRVMKHLEQIPYAQPERKRGEWEFYEDRSPVWDIAGEKTWARAYKCSECGFVHSVIEDFGQYAFCPNCGADMREGE